MDIRLNSILSPPGAGIRQPGKTDQGSNPSESFSEVLSREIEGGDIRFSKHAQARLQSRNLNLTSSELGRLSSAVDKAASKGIQDSLVLMNSVAFIVSVPDKTVVTAMPADEANIFTNIDGAVIA